MTTLKETAVSHKSLKRYVTDTVAMLAKIDVRKHNTAVMTVFHSAQFGECYNLNAFFNALKVNDQTALKAWIVKNFSGVVDDKPVHWLMYTNKKNANGETIGWHVLKNTSDVRVDRYDFDQLLELEPFYDTDVSKTKVWDVNALLDVLIKAADTIEKKSEKENITLPPAVTEAIKEAKRLAVLNHVEEAAVTTEVVANDDKPAEPVKTEAEQIADKYIEAKAA